MQDMKKRYLITGIGVAVLAGLLLLGSYHNERIVRKCNQGDEVACDELLDLPHPDLYSDTVSNPYFTTALKAKMKARAQAKADAAQAKAVAAQAHVEAIK